MRKPPLNDKIAFALARMVDDAQTDRRDPAHSDIDFCVSKWRLTPGDPKSQGQNVGKAKRVRAVLCWAIEHSFDDGCGFVGQLISLIQSCGGFRHESPNYVGVEAIANLREAIAAEGFVLSPTGDLSPATLDSLSGAELTEALTAYVRRAQRGTEDAALLIGTSKDLLEAISAHVLRELLGHTSPQSNFPTLLGQAFVALELKTTADSSVSGESPQHRLQRALYEAACAVNTLRNKQGTGHGRPWLPLVNAEEARLATQVIGVVGDLLLQTLRAKRSYGRQGAIH